MALRSDDFKYPKVVSCTDLRGPIHMGKLFSPRQSVLPRTSEAFDSIPRPNFLASFTAATESGGKYEARVSSGSSLHYASYLLRITSANAHRENV